MSFAQRMHPIRAAYEARAADGKFFVKKILIPHIFILVFFILIGTFVNEEPTSLLVRLLSLAYPAIFTLWIGSAGSIVSLRFVAIYLGLFSVALSSALIFLSLNPVLLLYCPYAVLVVALYPLALSFTNIVLSILPSFALILLLEIVRIFLVPHFDHTFIAVLIAGATSLSILLILSKIFRMRGLTHISSDVIPQYLSSSQIRSGLHKESSAIVEAARWLVGFRHAWNVELAREALWRTLLVAISSHALLVVTYTLPNISLLIGGLISLSLAVFQAILFTRLTGDAPKEGVLTRLFVFVVGSFLPSLLVISTVTEVPATVKVLFLVVFLLSISLLFWDKKFAFSLYVISISCVALVFYKTALLIPALLISSLILIVIFRVSMIGYLGVATRSAGSLLGRYCLLFRDPKEVMDVFALTISDIGETGAPLLLSSAGEAYTITSKINNVVQADLPIVQTFLQVITDLQRNEGLLSSEKLSEQHRGFLLDCFDTIPNRMIYFVTNGVVNEREETIAILLPVTPMVRIYGLTRFLRAAATLFSPIKLCISSVRGHFISTDHFESQQRSISEREEEINEMVHLVNNSAQDIAIHCEAIRQELEQESLSKDKISPKNLDQVFDQIMQIDISAKTLSEGVSDIKLVRELMSLKNLEHVEVVPVRRLLEDLENFARHRARRKGEGFDLIADLKEDQGIQVASRDFMQTVLRLLVRIAGRRLDGSGRVEVKVLKEGGNIIFLVRDNGRVVSEDTRAAVGLTFHPSHSGVHGEEYLRAVGDFARFSKGSFSFEGPSTEYSNSMKLVLPAAEIPPAKVVTPGQWALLVDDNRQVTTFYARVAEALKLRYFTAVSVNEAKNILKQEGKPRLVITDIQLDGSSGIDVVRDVRERYGNEVPIVVVSGQADESLSRQVLQAGATKCLMKPVGRRKLFAEIEEIL